MRRRAVWIVSHFEFLGPPYWRDEIISHVATTKSRALKFLRRMHVDPGTWWGIQCFRLDDPEWLPRRQELYSRGVRPLKSGYSLKQALKMSRKVRERNAALLAAAPRAQKKEGGTKDSPSRPRGVR